MLYLIKQCSDPSDKEVNGIVPLRRFSFYEKSETRMSR